MIAWNEDYKNTFYNTIIKKLPDDFVKYYDKSEWFHDFELVDFYLANTGDKILEYSKKGKSSLQMVFSTHDNSYIL